jgi:hypothetical protein
MNQPQGSLLEDTMKRITFARLITIAAVAWAAQGSAWAQAAPLAPGQVSGAEIQSWFDADGFAMAGINVGNKCYFMARTNSDGRRQIIDCPNQPSTFSVFGEGKVVGNQLCSKFGYPDGSKIDRCQDIFKVGDNKYEIRVGGQVTSVFQRLLR